jgi:hypothetical protein
MAMRLVTVAVMNNSPAVVARTSRDLMARLLLVKPRREGHQTLVTAGLPATNLWPSSLAAAAHSASIQKK